MAESATAAQPTGPELVRLRFRGGPLAGAVLDLPADVAELADLRLIVAGERVYDRRDNYRQIPAARVIRAPASSRAIVTARTHPAIL